MFVAASTDCFRDISLEECVEKLVDLQFSSVELVIDENGNHIRPSEVVSNFDQAVLKCTSTRRLSVAGYNLVINETDAEYLRVFEQCAKLAKATRVVSLSVQSGEHGTPFNEEVERFKSMVKIAEKYGVRVGVRSQTGHLSADPDTVSVICGHVDGLGLALDPSHYIYKQDRELNYDQLLKYVQTVYLRDSTNEELQVRVGQGVVDFGKLINQLRKLKYDRALVVDIAPVEDVDHMGEMRKMRLLLESLLLA